MRWQEVSAAGALLLLGGCGGTVRHGEDSATKQAALEACFALGATQDTSEVNNRLLGGLGVGLAEGTVDPGEANAKVRAQQLVDAVELALHGGTERSAVAVEVLRSFVKGRLLSDENEQPLGFPPSIAEPDARNMDDE